MLSGILHSDSYTPKKSGISIPYTKGRTLSKVNSEILSPDSIKKEENRVFARIGRLSTMFKEVECQESLLGANV